MAGSDLSGYVKGWAVEEAAYILEAAGARDYVINAGGDVLVRGEPESGRTWIVGIRHPLERDLVVARVALPAGERSPCPGDLGDCMSGPATSSTRPPAWPPRPGSA